MEKNRKKIYKELLIHINLYKTLLIQQNQFTENCMGMIECLNSPLYMKDFFIQKLDATNSSIKRIHNRYNVITFFIFLNDVEDSSEIILTDCEDKSNNANVLSSLKNLKREGTELKTDSNSYVNFCNLDELNVEICNNATYIYPRKTNLLLFPDNMMCSYNDGGNKPLYIISGHFCSGNVIPI